MTKIYSVFLATVILAGCQREIEIADVPHSLHCDKIPRPGNAQLTSIDVSSDWFRVYETAPNTYAIVEPFHYQETISHLIVGEDRALLFDTGMGFFPIRPVVERITDRPVTVFNSHTHYDHVGGNAEFDEILAVDTDYTRANMAGFTHDRIASETAAAAFCPELPDSTDRETFSTKAWRASRSVREGEMLDLGGRKLQVLLIPGHTPDATALLDADNGLLFTGDTYYDAAIWLFARETSVVDYAQSIARLAKIEGDVTYLLGAHNEARVDAGALAKVKTAFENLLAEDIIPVDQDDGIMRFDIDGVEFVTSEQALQGRQSKVNGGGSGIEGW